jgi:hypothetical protein
VLLPHRAAGTGIERVTAGLLVVVRNRRARLERHAGDARDMQVELHDVVGGGKRLVGRRAVPEKGLDRHVARQLVPHRRRAGLDRVLGVGDERQFLVVDLDRLGGVERLVLGFGDHHRHRLTDMPRLVGRQQHVRTDEDLAAAGRVQLQVVASLRQRIVRDRAEIVGQAIGAGEHAEHAFHLARAR